MSPRTKLILPGVFLMLLLAIPLWHVGSNWNPANPLRFRLVSREKLPEREGIRSGRVEFEIVNTSTAPRYIETASLKRAKMPFDPHSSLAIAGGTLIPAGGTLRVGCTLPSSLEGSTEPDDLAISCKQASTARRRLLSWYTSFLWSLPESLQHHRWPRQMWLSVYVHSEVPLES